MKFRSMLWVVAFFVAALVLSSDTAQACSVCYGDPDSPMARGLTWGIFVLVSVVLVVLAGISAFFVHVARRSKSQVQ